MNPPARYENFPPGMVLLCSAVSIAIYATGVLILSGLGIGAVALYIVVCLGLEFRLLKASCANCFYYGRWCGFGKGKLSALLFKKGDPRRFAARTISWRDLLPDMLVFLLPLLGGIVLLIQDFDGLLLIALAALLALSSGVTGYIRGSVSCPHCAQREIGCPAQQLFQSRPARQR